MTAYRFDDVRQWVFNEALPFWAERGVDRQYGGFVEALDFEGRDAGVAFKRVRVACRQIYCFSHAKLLGWGDALEDARRGAQYLVDRAWLGDDKGFARRLNRDGSMLDPQIDLYDNAFALFAFAWLYRATGDVFAKEWTARTLEAIQHALAHPGGEGFWHDLGREGPRQQNPHMHLLEACHAAYEATHDAVYLSQADEAASLFERRFFDGRTLAEFFNDDWTRAAGDAGRLVEPGHQFEWAWILSRHQKFTGRDLSASIRALIDFGETHGIDPASGATFNATRDDGAPIDKGSRTWPNTERLKAAVADIETLGRDGRAAGEAAVSLLLDRYLAVTPRGGWIDAFDAAGRPVAANVPASTLYHVLLAFAEYLRVEPLWRKAA